MGTCPRAVRRPRARWWAAREGPRGGGADVFRCTGNVGGGLDPDSNQRRRWRSGSRSIPTTIRRSNRRSFPRGRSPLQIHIPAAGIDRSESPQTRPSPKSTGRDQQMPHLRRSLSLRIHSTPPPKKPELDSPRAAPPMPLPPPELIASFYGSSGSQLASSVGSHRGWKIDAKLKK